jgi:hypothetical protein
LFRCTQAAASPWFDHAPSTGWIPAVNVEIAARDGVPVTRASSVIPSER